MLYLFTKEGFTKGAHLELRDHQDATSRFLLSALLVENDSVIGAIRRELRRVVDVLVDDEAIVKVLQGEVVKRDNLEGPEAEAAHRRCCKAEAKIQKVRQIVDKVGPPVGADDSVPIAEASAES